MPRITAVAVPVAHLVGPGQLQVRNGQLAYKPLSQPTLRLDPRTLREILCYGDVAISAPALAMLWKHNIQTAWLTPSGHRCQGRLAPSSPSFINRRCLQLQVLSLPHARCEWARQLILGKLDAYRAAARHHQRHGRAHAGSLLQRLRFFSHRTRSAGTLAALRGYEGGATAAWFLFYATLFTPPWTFPGRRRRPPTDPVNALLSLGYTLLLQRVQARLEALGYEIALGALHDLHPGRPSLACDLLEPLRCQVDRWVLAVCTSGQLTPEHFLPLDPTRGVRLQPAAFSSMLADWERHWQAYQLERSLQLWLQRWETFLQTSAPAQNVPPNSCHSPKNEQPPHKMLDIDAQKTYSEALARDEQQGLHLMEDG